VTIKLYGFGPSRSQRCEWALSELGLEYTLVNVIEGGLLNEPEFKKINPFGAMPAIDIDGKTLFESAAICTYLADLHPEKSLIGASGSWERALHDQWVSYTLANMEAWLWSIAKQKMRYPEEKRVPAVIPSNVEEFRDAASVLDGIFAESEYLIGEKFSMIDVILGYTVNWARKAKLLEGFENLQAYNKRLLQRNTCPIPE